MPSVEPGSFKVDWDLLMTHELNLETSAGYTWQSFGFKKKGDCEPLIRRTATAIVEQLKAGHCAPNVLWKGAGRAKQIPRVEAHDKALAGEPMGRMIWVGDAEESLIGSVFSRPVMAHCRD